MVSYFSSCNQEFLTLFEHEFHFSVIALLPTVSQSCNDDDEDEWAASLVTKKKRENCCMERNRRKGWLIDVVVHQHLSVWRIFFVFFGFSLSHSQDNCHFSLNNNLHNVPRRRDTKMYLQFTCARRWLWINEFSKDFTSFPFILGCQRVSPRKSCE